MLWREKINEHKDAIETAYLNLKTYSDSSIYYTIQFGSNIVLKFYGGGIIHLVK